VTVSALAAVPSRDCPLCPRLVAFREVQRAAHSEWFNAPVPSFGDDAAELLIVGLAPGLKGANRTGRRASQALPLRAWCAIPAAGRHAAGRQLSLLQAQYQHRQADCRDVRICVHFPRAPARSGQPHLRDTRDGQTYIAVGNGISAVGPAQDAGPAALPITLFLGLPLIGLPFPPGEAEFDFRPAAFVEIDG